jgi:multidrug efflux pump subunit AcrB
MPGVANVIDRDVPGPKLPVSQLPVDVAVCVVVSLFVHVIVSPARTVIVLGWNEKSLTLTPDVAAYATSGSASKASDANAAARWTDFVDAMVLPPVSLGLWQVRF